MSILIARHSRTSIVCEKMKTMAFIIFFSFYFSFFSFDNACVRARSLNERIRKKHGSFLSFLGVLT